MSNTWQDVAATVANLAPGVGAAIGGPIGAGAGIAIKVLAGIFGIKSTNPQPEEVIKAIQGDPQAALKLELARIDFERFKLQTDLDQTKTYLADIQSARDREKSIVQSTGKKDINLYVLAWTILSGFFGLIAVLVFVTVPQDSSGVIYMLFGALSAGFGSVIQYFFGSSAGSAAKSQAMEKILGKSGI